jgi:hypothetical protein
MSAAFAQRFTGTTTTLALTVEGELLFLAGVAIANRWLLFTGVAAIVAAAVHLFAVDFRHADWIPGALVLAAACIGNRVMESRAVFFTPLAAIILGAVSIEVLPSNYVSPLWAIAALIAFRAPYVDLKYTAAAAASLAWARAALVDLTNHHVVSIAVVIAALYALHPHASYAATSLLTVLIFNEVSGRVLTLALGAEGAALLTAGFLVRRRSLRLSGLTLFTVCIGKLFVYDLRELDTPSRILSFIVLGLVLLAASWLYTRFRETINRLL